MLTGTDDTIFKTIMLIMKIKKGDTVKIIVGKDKGKEGKVLKVIPKDNKVLIDGLNLAKKHRRPKRQGEKGEIIQVPRPIDASNIMLVCGSCRQVTRVGYKILEPIKNGVSNGARQGKKRICRKCASEI